MRNHETYRAWCKKYALTVKYKAACKVRNAKRYNRVLGDPKLKESDRLAANRRHKRREAEDPEYKRKKRESHLRWRVAHKTEWREYCRKYDQRKRETDPSYLLARNLRSRIGIAMRRNYTEKAVKTVELLGCSVAAARAHLESIFDLGMSWDNYGKHWEIDHIKPCATFDLTIPFQQQRCFHFTNLRPLPIAENRRRWHRDLKHCGTTAAL